MQMSGTERRQRIVELLMVADEPLSGTALAKELGVSRQIIVQDMALLRTREDLEILSTYQGYLLHRTEQPFSRVFKVRHSTERTEEELLEIVDLGGRGEDGDERVDLCQFLHNREHGAVCTKGPA